MTHQTAKQRHGVQGIAENAKSHLPVRPDFVKWHFVNGTRHMRGDPVSPNVGTRHNRVCQEPLAGDRQMWAWLMYIDTMTHSYTIPMTHSYTIPKYIDTMTPNMGIVYE